MKLKIIPSLLLEHIRPLEVVNSYHFPEMMIVATPKGVYFRVCDSVIFGQAVIGHSDPSLEVIEEGVAMVPAAFFIDLLRRLEHPLELSWKDNKGVIISRQEGEFNFTSQDSTQFPAVPPEQALTPVDMPCADLLFLIDRLVPLALSDRAAGHERCVAVRCNNEGMWWQATDFCQLSRIRLPFTFDVPTNHVVQAHFFHVIGRVLPRQGSVRLSLGKQNIYVSFGRVILQCAVSSMMREMNFESDTVPYRLTLNRARLLTSLECMEALSDNDLSAAVVVSLWGQQLVLDLHTHHHREGRQELMCAYQGPPMKLAINLAQLARTVRLGTDDIIHIDLLSPALFVTIHCDNTDTHLHYLMPMSLPAVRALRGEAA
jgi:DNA polymerase III sliding clamp (beta) subunit (PCNA family)